MIGVLGHDSALQGYTGPGTTWANEMNFVMNLTPGAGSNARHWPVVQRATTVPRMPLTGYMKLLLLLMKYEIQCRLILWHFN